MMVGYGTTHLKTDPEFLLSLTVFNAVSYPC